MKLVPVLSFDCAYKSLAFVYATVNIEFAEDFSKKKQDILALANSGGNPAKIAQLVIEAWQLSKDFINVHKSGVIDVLKGKRLKDVDEVSKANLLKEALEERVGVDLGENAIILIEKQPSAINTPSSIVQAQLILFYRIKTPHAKLLLISPKKKNEISLAKCLAYSNFEGGKGSRYADNKAHSKSNFEYFLEVFGMGHLLNGIKKTNYDDLADAFMQILVIFN